MPVAERRSFTLAFLALSLLALPVGAGGGEITLARLLNEMVDLRGLARLPEIPYVARQASSYDRASKGPDDAKGWFANRDAGQYVRVEEVEGGGKRYVMMDAPGPGAVTRIWSANPKGTLRIHIDGDLVVEAPMVDLLSGKHESFPEPFAYKASLGCNLYFPFPYEKRCKVTSDEGGFYYQVGYRTYPEGTKVESFSLAIVEKAKEVTHRVSDALRDPGRKLLPLSAAVMHPLTLEPGGDRIRLPADPGGSAATILALKPPRVEPAVLRRTVLSCSFDGIETIRVPLGDFFGTGPGVNPYESVPFRVEGGGGLLTSLWVMPFQESMEIGIEGKGIGPVRGSLGVEPIPWDDSSLYFHALWRAEYDIPTEKQRD